jgi:hypothetical protein
MGFWRLVLFFWHLGDCTNMIFRLRIWRNWRRNCCWTFERVRKEGRTFHKDTGVWSIFRSLRLEFTVILSYTALIACAKGRGQ